MKRILFSFATLLVLQIAVFARTETKIKVGRNPYFVAVNSATDTIYSSNASEGTISVVDGATENRTATIPVAGYPQGIAANSATNTVYVALYNGFDSNVAVIDGDTNTVVTSIPVPWADYLAVDATTNRIYTSDADNTVRVIDGGSNSVIATISFSDVLEQLAVDETRNLIYIAVAGITPTIGVIDGTNNAVVNSFTLSKAKTLAGLAVDPALNQIYASDNFKLEVFIVDGATGSVTVTIGLPGAGNPKYAVVGSGHQVAVSDSATGRVFFINGITKTLSGSVSLPYSPYGMASNPVTKNIYVALALGAALVVIAP